MGKQLALFFEKLRPFRLAYVPALAAEKQHHVSSPGEPLAVVAKANLIPKDGQPTVIVCRKAFYVVPSARVGVEPLPPVQDLLDHLHGHRLAPQPFGICILGVQQAELTRLTSFQGRSLDFFVFACFV